MKRSFVFLLLACSSVVCSKSQVTITEADLFNEVGLYYRVYANRYDPLDITGGTAFTVPGDLIGDAGPDQFWDFSTGPTNKVFRFDYVLPSGFQAAEFQDAALMEVMTDESDQSQMYLFFDSVPGVGRMVRGYYAQNPFFTPSNVFESPILDFPDPISFGQEWSTSARYENQLSIIDPDPEEGGSFDFGQRTTLTSTFKADAYGTILLPDELGGFGPGLRINEQVTIDSEINFGEGYEHLQTDFTRNYYWLMPGRGIVAQLNSTQSSSPPPEKFPRAVAFLRMFETNKRVDPAGGGCTNPDPVTDLRARINSGVVLLTWSKANCATQYEVQYSATPAVPGSWQALGAPTTLTRWLGETTALGSSRYYRVVSMK